MLFVGEHSQVSRSVVSLLPVDVMNFFVGLECAHALTFNSFSFWLAQYPRTKEYFFKPEDELPPPQYEVEAGQMQ